MAGHEERIWNGLAPRYDRTVRWFSSRYNRVRLRLQEDLPPDGRVLELAAGTGQFTETIASVSRHVVATDLATEMTSQLSQRMSALGLDHVEVRTMSAYAIGGNPYTFDAVVCANALHIMEEPEVALGEIHRVLRPEGLLIAPTFCHGHTRMGRFVSRAMTRFSAFEVYSRFSTDTLAALVTEHGFAVETCESLGGLLPLVYLVARRV